MPPGDVVYGRAKRGDRDPTFVPAWLVAAGTCCWPSLSFVLGRRLFRPGGDDWAPFYGRGTAAVRSAGLR